MEIKRIKLSIEEQIEKKEESIKQLKNQKIQLKKKLNEQERKARNKRLIEKGAVFESVFEESINLTIDEFYKLMKMFEYSRAVTPQIRQAGNRLSGLAETAYASLLA